MPAHGNVETGGREPPTAGTLASESAGYSVTKARGNCLCGLSHDLQHAKRVVVEVVPSRIAESSVATSRGCRSGSAGCWRHHRMKASRATCRGSFARTPATTPLLVCSPEFASYHWTS